MLQLHRLTGEFRDAETERRFRTAQLPRMQHDCRLAYTVTALLIVMFAISDYNFLGPSRQFQLLLAIRGVMAAGCLLLALLASSSPRLLTHAWFYNILPALVATGLMLIIALRPQTLSTQLTAEVVVVMAFYLFAPNYLRGMIGSNLYLIAGFLFGAWYWAGMSPTVLIQYFLLLILANIVGYMVALRLAKLQREHFVLEARLRHMAHTDELTGLGNRRYFLEGAKAALASTRRHGQPFSLCMIDIDHFKAINDTLGHGAGDRVLKEVANACRISLREGEPLGRFGGEEFVAALPDANLEQARHVAERLRKKVAELRFDAELADLQVTVTIGVAEVLAQETKLEPALERADAALYRGKRSGRDTVLAEA